MASGRLYSKGCAFAVAIWLLLIAAYAYVAWQKIGEPVPAAIIGLLGGTIAGMLLSSFIGLFTGGNDRAALRRAAAHEPPRDGRLEAAHGQIRAEGSSLEAPFTGQPCVAYEYDVKRMGQGQSDFAGYALTPCAVHTLRGPVRVLGWSMLDQFPAASGERIDLARGERYLASAAFETLGVTRIFSIVNDLIADDDGTIRKDFRIAGDAVVLDGRRIQERSVPDGATVTLLGHWSEARRGFVASGASMNRLFSGDLDQVKRNVGGNAVTTFGMAVVFFLVLHAILVPMYFLAPKAAAERRAATAGSVWDERDCDRQKTMLDAGADPNERGSDARTPLMNAARLGAPECVEHLVAAGARLEDRDKFSDTALVHAVTAGRDDNATLLLGAGAKEFRVTASAGHRVAGDDQAVEAVREYIAAVHRGDFEAMGRLMAHTSVRRMEDQRGDLPLWQSIRPQRFTIEEGWTSDGAATILIRGGTPSGEQRIWYHLERQPGGWQIRKEWFVER